MHQLGFLCARAQIESNVNGGVLPYADKARSAILMSSDRSQHMMITSDWLLAEDEESDVVIFQRALKKAQLAVELRTFRDGQELVDHLSEGVDRRVLTGSRPVLLVLDLKMPRMNGFDVLMWLKTQPHLSHLPAVVLSSSVYESDMRKALELGAREYLVKPTVPGELVSMVETMHERFCTNHALTA